MFRLSGVWNESFCKTPWPPSMIQLMQHPCNECKGTGETINDRDRCPQCKGEKVVPEKKVLEVVVEKGMQNGQKITFPGEADEAVSQPTILCIFFRMYAHLLLTTFLEYNIYLQSDTITPKYWKNTCFLYLLVHFFGKRGL